MRLFIRAVIALLTLSDAADGAPVPTHLMKPLPDPVVPGLVFRCGDYLLLVTRVEGDVVTFDSVDRGATFRGDDGLENNQYLRAGVLRCLKEHPQPTRE